MKFSLIEIVAVSQLVFLVVSSEPSTLCYNGFEICEQLDPNRPPPPLEQQARMMQPGRGTQRGPDWSYGDEDGGPGSVGEIMDRDTGSDYLFWVHWPNGNERMYFMEGVGTYDLMLSQNELDDLDDCWDLDGNMCADGETCGDIDIGNCAGGKTCQSGYLYDCTCANEGSGQKYSKCCILEGQLYPNGRYNDFCAPLQCASTPDKAEGFWFWQGFINENCKKCTSFMDPHVVTFDEEKRGKNYESYGYQGCGQYSMAQEGVSYSPEFGIFSRFSEYCGYGVSCVSAAIMNQDDIQIIAESPHREEQVYVTVNGVDYDVSPIAEFVPVEGNDKVLGWTQEFDNDYVWSNYDSNCVFFQGTKGLMIQFCGNQWANTLYIWAMPVLVGQINGMCGSLTNDASDDYTTRQGTILQHSSSSITEWATTWLTDPSDSTNCPSFVKKMHIRTKEACMNFDIYEAQCNATISSFGSSLQPAEIQDLIAACTFDLCNVDDPEGYLEGAVAETVKIQDHVEDVSVNVTSPEGCGRDLEGIGAECFKRIPTQTMDWESAKSLCLAEGLYLAEPWDINTVATHLLENYDEQFYWVGGRSDGEVCRWLSGGEVSNAEPWMQGQYEVSGELDRCLDLATYGNFPARTESLAAGYCDGTTPRTPLCSMTRRIAQ